MSTLNTTQSNALVMLAIALQNATDCNLFDNIDVHPDIINQFCDAIGEVEEDIKNTCK